MSEYKFYGWKNATVQDKNGLTPRDYYDLLANVWCRDTCTPRLRKEWSTENKTLGQCSVTAFLIQDIFGGKVYGIRRSGGNYHCFNVVGDCIFDLTSEQFGDEILNYENCQEQSKEVHFSKKEKQQRYAYLKSKLIDSVQNCLSSV